MKVDVGILAFGAYIPRRRLQRSSIFAANGWFNPGLKGLAKGERAVASWDEDVITMAVEASRDCLGETDRTLVRRVVLASTTAPFADRLNAGVVKEALNLPDEIDAVDSSGSQRAGTSALRQLLEGAATSPALCIAAELRRARPASEGELVQGDAAAAVLVGPGHPIARYLGGASLTTDFVDHFRSRFNEFDYSWESRWIRDEGYARLIPSAIKQGLAAAGVAPAQVDHLVVPIAARNVALDIAKKAGIAVTAVVDGLGAQLGDTGVAHPLVMLASVLEAASPGQTIMVVGFGQGCDVLLFQVTEAVVAHPKPQGVSGWLERRSEETNYLRHLFFSGLLDLDKGMRAEMDQKQPLTALYRNRKAVLGLVGGRSKKTGTVQFPRSEISVDPNDRTSGTQEDYPLAEKRARLLTYTADNLTYSPDPPQYYGMIEFEGGGRMMAEIVDADPDEIAVGKLLTMMFRIKSTDDRRGFVKYFWKAVPERNT